MIFLRYESFREYIRLYPIVTGILAINILLYLITVIPNGERWLYNVGALTNHPLFVDDWWRYITSIFLHSGIGHVLFNGFSLFLFAPYLERLLGKGRFTILYLVSGIVGNLLTVWLISRPIISVGASGAIYGLFGMYIFMTLYRKRYIDAQSSKMIVIILVIGVIYSLIGPGINIAAHLGGFIGGYLISSLLLLKQ